MVSDMFMKQKRASGIRRQKIMHLGRTLKRNVKKKSKRIKKYKKKKSKKTKKYKKRKSKRIKKYLNKKQTGGGGSMKRMLHEPPVNDKTIEKLKQEVEKDEKEEVEKDEISINVIISNLGAECKIKIDKNATTLFWDLVEAEINTCEIVKDIKDDDIKIFSMSFGGTEVERDVTIEELGIEDDATINVTLDVEESDLKVQQDIPEDIKNAIALREEDRRQGRWVHPNSPRVPPRRVLEDTIIHKKYGSVHNFLRNVKKHVNDLVFHNFNSGWAGEELRHPYIEYVAKGDTVLLEGIAVEDKSSDITTERMRLPEGPIPEGTIKVLWRPGNEIKKRITIRGPPFRSIKVSWWDNGDGFDYAQQEINRHT